jgi:hypothetical protein
MVRSACAKHPSSAARPSRLAQATALVLSLSAALLAVVLSAGSARAQATTAAPIPPALPAPAPEREPDPWVLFHFLDGDWTGSWSGEPGASTSGSASFSYDLQRRVLVYRTKVEFPPRDGSPFPSVHEELLVIYREGAVRHQGLYFDSDGRTIDLPLCSASSEPSIMLQTDRRLPGPWYRLVFKMTPEGALSLDFLSAPRGERLQSRVKGIVHRLAP